MKCISCSVEINPKWTHAIDMNVCPFCGKHIMEEHLKNLFATLRNTMASLSEYQDQLNDWMLSNHDYIKTNSPRLIEFIPKEFLEKKKDVKRESDNSEDKKFVVKVKNEDGSEDEIVAEKIQSEETTNEFFKRAEAIKPNIDGFQSTAQKNQHLKKLAQQIKRAGSSSIGTQGETTIIPPEMMENADPEAVAEFESILDSDNISSSLVSGNTDDEIPDVVLRMANGARGNTGKNNADLLKIQQQQERLRNSRENFESGAARGKNGFSRSG